MKTRFKPWSHGLIPALMLLALAPALQAKDKDKGPGPGRGPGPAQGPGHGSGNMKPGKMEKHQVQDFKKVEKFQQKVVRHDEHGHGPDHAREVYMAYPRTKYVLTQGDGYAGRGYYYGPPNMPYYYQHSDVKYYSRREDFPRGYGMSRDARVQQELARLGYYRGPIDGSLGPQSMMAVGRYQRDHGMPITNIIVPALLRALGIQ